MAKARPGGPDYIYALLTGYRPAPAGFQLAPGMHYNVDFPGHQVAMPPPLFDGAVKYTDGTKPTVDNYARDVAAYLMWAAQARGAGDNLSHRLCRDHVPGEADDLGAPARQRRAHGVAVQCLDPMGAAAEDGARTPILPV